MQDNKQKISELVDQFETFYKSMDLVKKKELLGLLEGKTTDPALWNDQDRARKILQEFADLKKEIDETENLKEEIEILKQLIQANEAGEGLEKEIARSEKTLERLTFSMFLSGPYDQKNAVVAIHAGQGGTEAMDWTSMLLRMYLRYCEIKGWKTCVVDLTAGEEAGIKSVTLTVAGGYAYGYLKHEAGTHRLVRQSPFNADNLRQTSFALVEVLPEFEEVDLPDIQIKDEDLELQFFHSSSQGGQNVQKVSTAVRIIHKPTGLVVSAQSERFQEQNRKIAMNLLRAKLWALEQRRAEDTKKEIRGDYRPASWGNQIRSYVLHPYKMVKDLRTGVESANPDSVLDGNLDLFIDALVRAA